MVTVNNIEIMKTYEFKAATIEEAREYISGIEADLINEGDKATVTLSNGLVAIFEVVED